MELTLPPWFSLEHTFRVRHDGTQKLTPQRRHGRLVFHFAKLVVTEVIVVTQSDELMGSMTATVAKLHARLVQTPERTPSR